MAKPEISFSPPDQAKGAGIGLSPAMLDQAVARALQMHQRGRLQEASEGYGRVLAADPDHAEANHLLGLIWHQTGRNAEAAELIGKAIAREPGNAIYRTNLGVVLKELGRLDEAVASYDRALQIDPSLAQVHSNRGVALLGLGRAEDAVAAQQQALSLDPSYAEAHANLGLALEELGRREEAVESYRRAIALKPDYANAHSQLAHGLASVGRLDEALASAQQAVLLRPASAAAQHTLGGVQMELGQLVEAADSFRKAAQIRPDPIAYRNLGHVLAGLGRHRDAASALEAAIAGNPKDATAHLALGRVLYELSTFERATDSFRRAAALQPDDVDIQMVLGAALLAAGRIEAAETEWRTALPQAADPRAIRAALMFASNYRATTTPAEIAADARAYGESVARRTPARSVLRNIADPQKRLRIGLVSGDFRDHPVAKFLEGVVAALDGEKLELFAYSTGSHSDDMTERFKTLVDHWRPVAFRTNDQLEAAILADGIDVLIDLSGHTGGNRLLVFGRKPAPVTATWLGYSGTTGIETMDYIIADRFVAPPGSEDQFTEAVWRMPDSYLCFGPPADPPETAPLPALANGFVTFGSFNNLNKINPATLKLWAQVLDAVPRSRLVIKNKPLDKPDVADGLRRELATVGADLSRVDLLGFVRDEGGHLGTYNRIDIGLDPFPYNGTTTTCEALWMGVPVLTLAGDRFIGRVGESILNSVGLPDWVAATADDYVAQAVSAASNFQSLAALRSGLRSQMAASPLCDTPRFARNLEAAFREMWIRWCAGQRPVSAADRRA
ncbi:MAG: tetratricopeptide repeat protein [Devosia sp.]